ncbi:MAG TPA: preprotein translocase subunit SecG [Dehalococcoidia bacterium]|nr:preprotein translocase subunit SecG [Dehalococcoidia bacterium]
MSFEDLLFVLQILISCMLIFVVLLQVKGSGFGQALGGADTSYRTRRGLERTLMQLTIILVGFFVLVAVITARVS